jgi:hypothetical protein
MDELAKKIHDARRPLNNISMQAELIKMLVESREHAEDVLIAANKIVQYCQDCSEQLQSITEQQNGEISR